MRALCRGTECMAVFPTPAPISMVHVPGYPKRKDEKPQFFCFFAPCRKSPLVLLTIDRPTALMIPKILFLVEQVGPRTTQIYNLGTSIPVLFESRAFKAVKGVGDALYPPVSISSTWSQKDCNLPRRRRRRTCFGSFQTSTRRRCAPGLWGGRSCRIPDTFRRTYRRGGRLRCQLFCGT